MATLDDFMEGKDSRIGSGGQAAVLDLLPCGGSVKGLMRDSNTPPVEAATTAVEAIIRRWEGSGAAEPRQAELDVEPEPQPAAPSGTKSAKPQRHPWPKSLPEQVKRLREGLASQAASVTADVLAKSFTRACAEKVEEFLQTLVTLGQARGGQGRDCTWQDEDRTRRHC